MIPDARIAAQPGIEPEVRGIGDVRSPFDEGLKNTMTFNIVLNNFGFGIGTEYRRAVSTYSEFLMELQFTGLKDVTEQNYQFFGQQIIPDKRNRVLSFPLMVGYKHRLFAQPVSDNYRFYITARGGPSLAFVYPYYQLRTIRWIPIEDFPANGEPNPNLIRVSAIEANTGQLVNDVFQGWGDGFWMWGSAGEIAIGVDAGENFKNILSIKLGVTFQYFTDGIQVMDPFRALGTYQTSQDEPLVYVIETANPKQKLFTSPFFKITFGGLW